MDDSGNNHARKVELADILSIMRQENGRRFMYRQLTAAGYFGSTFVADPYTHAHRAGRREHGVWLMQELTEAAPDEVNRMLKENGNAS